MIPAGPGRDGIGNPPWERRGGRANTLLLAMAAAVMVACGPGSPDQDDGRSGVAEANPSPWVQTALALRRDTVPAPSSPEGLEVQPGPGAVAPAWGADGPATVDADAPFRIRFELAWPEAGVVGAATESRFRLEVRRNGGAWERLLARDFPYPDEISTPRVSIVDAGTWSHGTEAGDLLEGSEAAFGGGSGVSLDSITAPGSVRRALRGPVQTEWEWPVVIRRYADGAVTNVEGDIFEFRMVDERGRPAVPSAGDVGDPGYSSVRLAIPPRLVGGTYVETPGVLGPWQSEDGALYFPMEPAETFNVLMTVKSPDFGESWTEVGGDARPATDDLEGFGTAGHGGRIYMLHQISEATYLHAFATTDAGSGADRWVIRDELVAEHSEPPTQVAALVADPEGRLTAFYGDSLGLRVRVREASDTAGIWGEERRMDGPQGTVSSGVMAVRLDDGRIHAAYTAGNATRRDVWFRTVSAEGVPGEPVRVATGVGVTDDDIGALAPLVRLPGPGLTVIPYRLDDGLLYTRTVRPDGSLTPQARVPVGPVVQNGSDSEQVGVDAVGHEGRVILAYIAEESRDLGVIEGLPGADGSLAWEAPRPLVDDVYAQWVRGRVIRDAAGAPVYGIVYDAGSDGGSGMNRYVAYPLR